MTTTKRFRFGFLSLILFLSSAITAQIVSPFSVRYQTNAKGGIKFVSNVVLSCPNSNNCTTAKNEVPPSGS
ncbi:MAG: hypothetical protein ACK444_06195, partial [Flavobacteriales bacterium]